MKFFAALIAKLTGGDTAPKTLDQARSTFTEAKAALDKIGAMFSAAAIDFDALLAKGDTALKDFVTELNNKVTAAEASAKEANGKTDLARAAFTASEGQVTALNSQLSSLTSLLASIGFVPAAVKGTDAAPATAEQQATALQTQFKTHVAGAVTQKLQELGVPAVKLPAATGGAGAASTVEDLQAQLAEAKTPAEKGRIAAALNKLRDASWGKN